MKKFKYRVSRNGLLTTTAVLGLTAAMMASGIPARVQSAYADAVRVQAPQEPGFADVVEAVSPAVVSVRVRSDVKPVSSDGFNFGGPSFEDLPEDHPMRRFFRDFGDRFSQRGDQDQPQQRRPNVRPVSQGSGFFISDDGLVVTNNHVVDNGSEFTVIMHDGTELEAELIGKDYRTDLAVLKIIDADRKFTYVDFDQDDKTRIGDWVVAVGNPFGLGGTVTAGIVSARGRDIGSGPYDDFIQVDAAVNRGNSGGPTFNLEGEVIGVNTAIFSPSGGNVGIAFAIPASLADEVVQDLIKDGSVERGWLGVQIQPLTEDIAESLGLSEAKGALVTEPQDGSPAIEAGVKSGDVVTAVDGELVDSPRDLARKIAAIDPGKDAELTIWRDGDSRTVSVEIGTLAEPRKEAAVDGPKKTSDGDYLEEFGLTVMPADDGHGLLITKVEPDSAAAERGMREGDMIVAVNNTDVRTAKELSQAVEEAAEAGRKAVLFQLSNQDSSRFVALPVATG
ncbi:Do family serine endopeptidase [Hoeflea prorocentri]|uniref:Probable periplasmic serine endoprotease DegP-like n=1 Tax=Hoeflea prorocentri TaxID=1922333 RepID=A0A9X3ULQ0_9HYPH|nr:Do family serine endopeptidase [Hoeflea prorocentri]MCY6381499.1 Do family serine endopeptidase [Hoeflea prorocentri]MDA5399299.1 Do family serine endopeptidase [Hoeflea prorocentri]